MKLSNERSWLQNPSVVFSPLAGRLALLDTQQNIYYSLDGIGPFLWESIAAERCLAELCAAVVDHYAVDAATAQADISEWLDQMTAAGLIVQRG